jgi:DNA/RNA-binding domain of Phe-tRNA-synthetase-like protein
MSALVVDPHPLFEPGVFTARLPAPLGDSPSPEWLVELLQLDAESPLSSDEAVRTAVRKLLRHGGYKPSGRGKPASEYLRAAATENTLGSINLAVDLCNAVSLHSGLPISVIDLDRAVPPLRVRVADEDAKYVFNPSGQEIDLTGLLALHDAEGPCANSVKDAMRTKTQDATTDLLCLVWGTRELHGHTARTVAWYRELSERAGLVVRPVELVEGT